MVDKNRDKQIEEMVSIMNVPCGGHCEECPCLDCGCLEKLRAVSLYNAGYRKTSDVAREIFEEIEKLISSECLVIKDEEGIRGYVDASVHYILAELKKKYLGEDINAPTKESEGI